MEALGINPSGLITQIVSFIILFGILYSLLYKPLLKMIDQRAARIKEGLDQADSAREEAAHSRADMADQVAKARAEGQQMMVQAREIAQRFREEELEKAKQKFSMPGSTTCSTSMKGNSRERQQHFVEGFFCDEVNCQFWNRPQPLLILLILLLEPVPHVSVWAQFIIQNLLLHWNLGYGPLTKICWETKQDTYPMPNW